MRHAGEPGLAKRDSGFERQLRPEAISDVFGLRRATRLVVGDDETEPPDIDAVGARRQREGTGWRGDDKAAADLRR